MKERALDHRLDQLTVETPTPLALPPPPSERPAGRRFALVYAALGVILVGSLAALVVFGLKPGVNSSPVWSSWKPSPGSLPVMAKQIADHVGPKYRFANGRQLMAVVPSPPTLTAGAQNVAISAVSVRSRAGGDQSVSALVPGKAEMYTLCGLGVRCSIASGTPSASRGQLVRRAALEVALHTFKYIPAVDSVLVYMPPVAALGPTQAPTYVLYFDRESLSDRLDLPLKETLALATPPYAGQADLSEARMIDALTLSHLYASGLVQLQIGGALLALVPVA